MNTLSYDELAQIQTILMFLTNNLTAVRLVPENGARLLVNSVDGAVIGEVALRDGAWQLLVPQEEPVPLSSAAPEEPAAE
jgi:hypothetical protein